MDHYDIEINNHKIAIHQLSIKLNEHREAMEKLQKSQYQELDANLCRKGVIKDYHFYLERDFRLIIRRYDGRSQLGYYEPPAPLDRPDFRVVAFSLTNAEYGHLKDLGVPDEIY